MKVILLFSSLLVVGIGLLIYTAKTKGSTNMTASKPAITWQMVNENLQNGSLLLDVRTTQEFTDGHIDGSTLFPVGDIEQGSLPIQDKSKPVYVYCRSGNRSSYAKSLLQQSGFTNVIDLGPMTNVANLGAKITR